jgi:cellulose synthase operon protein C
LRTNAKIVLIALVWGLGSAQACGPDFPLMLTECRAKCLNQIKATGFAFDVNLLTPAGAKSPPAANDSYPDGGAAWIDTNRDDAHAQLASMRAAPTGDAAYALGEGVPESKRLYAAGAVDFNRVHQWRGRSDAVAPKVPDADNRSDLEVGLTAAISWFERVVALPTDLKEPRFVWATYMLGRCFYLRQQPGDEARAIDAYRKTLSLVEAGSVDPLGLGNASLGELARIELEHRRYEESIGLYVTQAAQQEPLHGIESLWRVARELSDGQENLANAIQGPNVQKLLIAFALSKVDQTCRTEMECGEERSAPTPRLPSRGENILAALNKLPIKSIQWPDQVAGIAYALGDFDAAGRYAAAANTPYGNWIRAKLALRAGDSELAAQALARAIKPPAAAQNAMSEDAFARLRGESALVSLSRRDYVEALYQLSQAAGFGDDALYVAERVLTVDELKTVVDHNDWAKSYRDLLARRLARSNRVSEAIAYYKEPEIKTAALQLADDQRRVSSSSGAVMAAALYDQASLEISHGMELIGTERCPDFAEYGGGFGESCGLTAQDDFQTQSGTPLELVTQEEIDRSSTAIPIPNVRFHYRDVAVDHLMSAADALPKHSMALSAMLCHGVGWLEEHGRSYNEDLIQRLYKRYVHEGRPAPWAKNFGAHCPDPDFHTHGR